MKASFLQKIPTYFRFITALFICLLTGVEVDLFVPSFPELSRVFDLSPFMVELTLSLNFLAYCGCSLFMGLMGDKYGRRPTILISLVLFVVGSILCVVAANFSMLLVGRVFQGVGIAGPAAIGYLIVTDEYPVEKQASIMGILNGIIAISMAFAPVVGSYVTLYYDWRANFVVLLVLGVFCLLCAFFAVPKKAGDPNVRISLRAYKVLFQNPKMPTFIWAVCFLVVPYWMFVAVSPILYMEGLGVDLKHFGFYQGAIAGAFGIISLFSPKFLSFFGQERCFNWGSFLCFLCVVLWIIAIWIGINDPIIITGMMLVFAVGVVFPINIIFPQSLTLIKEASARAAAGIHFIRLIMMAVSIEAVSYFYKGTFFPLGITMAGILGVGLFFLWKLKTKKWVNFF